MCAHARVHCRGRTHMHAAATLHPSTWAIPNTGLCSGGPDQSIPPQPTCSQSSPRPWLLWMVMAQASFSGICVHRERKHASRGRVPAARQGRARGEARGELLWSRARVRARASSTGAAHRKPCEPVRQ